MQFFKQFDIDLIRILLGDDAFNGLENLSYLSLQSCNLDIVPKQAFAELKNLEELNLSKNPIK